MLKLLYKTLLISVMSSSLMTMNMAAFAQTAPTAQMSQSEDSGLTRDSNGVLKKTESHKFDGVKSADMLASITMLATGTIAGRMAAKYRPMTTDVMIAAVGGLAFIAGEVLSNIKFKKTIDDMSVEITKTNDGKMDQAQIDRLQDLKKSYVEAKKTTGTKKMLQLAAATAFAGAGALAAYMAYQEYSLFATCMGDIKTNSAAVKLCPEAVATPALSAVCEKCGVSLDAFGEQMDAINSARKFPGPSLIENGQVTPMQAAAKTTLAAICKEPSASSAAAIGIVTPACTAALTIQSLDQIFTYKPSALGADNGNSLLNKILFGSQVPKISYEFRQSRELSGFEKISDQVLNLFLPKADASWIPLLGLGASAAVSYFLISGVLATAVDMQMFVPFNRAIAFAALGGLSLLASQASQRQMDKLDANIAKIDQILKDLDALQNGIKANNVNEQQIKLATLQANQTADLEMTPNPATKTDCATSMGSSNCTPLANQLASMPGFADLPDSFKSIASQSAKVGDGLSGTNSISGSTLTAASSLAGKQNAVGKLLANTQKKLNDQLASMGKPKIDFAKEQNNFLKRLNAQTAKGLNSGGMSAGGFLSSIGGSPLSGSQEASKVADKGSSQKSPASGGLTGGASAVKDKGFDLDFKEAGAGEGTLAAGGAPQQEGKFDIGSNDINTNSGESIFQLISNRYIKSGYPKLLDEIPVKK
ncbi:MAG: hypothetical protein PHY93_08260 [Bacteriovorax sp.]|nr:hypothetical protein [Bacteriovorax sp.]